MIRLTVETLPRGWYVKAVHVRGLKETTISEFHWANYETGGTVGSWSDAVRESLHVMEQYGPLIDRPEPSEPA